MDFVALSKKYLDDARGLLKEKMVRQVLIVGLIVGAGVGGFYANRYFTNKKQRKAVSAFYDAMQSYYEALAIEMDWSKRDEKAAWDDVELGFDAAYQQNSGSSMAPYFLVYQARALAAVEKYAEAQDLIGKALDKMSECSPFYYLYQTVQASIMIDGGDTAGVDKLVALAKNSKNSYSDMAEYQLAQYYLSNNESSKARALFKKLAAKAKKDDKDSWANLAKEYV